MAIPRQVLVIAAGALATGAVLYVRNRIRDQKEDAARRDREKSRSSEKSSSSSSPPPAEAPSESSSEKKEDGPAQSGAVRELSLFLAGESWYDEIGWQGIWEREGIESAEGWLRSVGKDVLTSERKKLAAHPALLAGCRRRWIVVCRYGSIDVGDAAALWNATES